MLYEHLLQAAIPDFHNYFNISYMNICCRPLYQISIIIFLSYENDSVAPWVRREVLLATVADAKLECSVRERTTNLKRRILNIM